MIVLILSLFVLSVLSDSKYDFSGNHTWKNPFYPGDVEYIPNELYLTNTPESFDVEGSIVHHLLDNYTREYHYHYSHSGLFVKHTEDIFYYYHRLLVYDNSKGFAYKRVAWYTLELQPIIIFDPESYFTPQFKASLANLPKMVNGPNDVKKYDNFIRAYGTHYNRRAVMGGELNLEAWVHNCFLDEHEIYWVKEQTSFSFLGIISFGKMKEKYMEKVDKKFLEHVEMNGNSVGGVWKNGTTWDSYKDTLKGDLISPVFYDYDPITDLVSDPIVKQNLQEAINAYGKTVDARVNDFINEAKKEGKSPTPDWCKTMKNIIHESPSYRSRIN